MPPAAHRRFIAGRLARGAARPEVVAAARVVTRRGHVRLRIGRQHRRSAVHRRALRLRHPGRVVHRFCRRDICLAEHQRIRRRHHRPIRQRSIDENFRVLGRRPLPHGRRLRRHRCGGIVHRTWLHRHRTVWLHVLRRHRPVRHRGVGIGILPERGGGRSDQTGNAKQQRETSSHRDLLVADRETEKLAKRERSSGLSG